MFQSCFNFTIVLPIILWFFNISPSKVYFIPTFHGLHKTNTNYTYDSLINTVARLKPDIIAVEIRPEDIDQDSVYLSKNYPYEMRIMKYRFSNAHIMGFDWLGNDIEGKSIPNNYWKELSPIKKWEKELSTDSAYAFKASVCDTFTNQRFKIIKHHSLKDILESKDEFLTGQYYTCLKEQLGKSIHKRILNFYDQRNEEMLKNINTIIAKNKGKTIVILAGDDHFIYLKARFKHDKIF